MRISIIILVFITIPISAFADLRSYAINFYRSLAGTSPNVDSLAFSQVQDLLRQGKPREAARIVTTQDSFYNVTVARLARPVGDRDESPVAYVNDTVLAFIGFASEDRDARELLTGNFTYKLSENASVTGFQNLPAHSEQTNVHYEIADRLGVNFIRSIVKVNQAQTTDVAGVLTSRGWAVAHLLAGTNRRAVEYVFRQFLCTPLSNASDREAPQDHVRRDVDRMAGGSPWQFNNYCSSCHNVIDGMAAAFNYRDMTKNSGGNNLVPFYTLKYKTDGLGANSAFEDTGVAKKINKNNKFPGGYLSTNDSWVNYAGLSVKNQSQFGWRGSMSGTGVQSLGEMFANSKGFSACFAKKVYSSVCLHTDWTPTNMTADSITRLERAKQDIEHLADVFEKSNYNIRVLFEEAASLSQCVMGGAE